MLPLLLVPLLLLHIAHSSSCSLQTTKVPVGANNPTGIYPLQIDVTVNAGAKEFAGETSFTSGTTFTITCNRTGFTFTNGIRKVPGVDVYKINEGGQLIVTCINGYFWPNVWVQTEGLSATDTSYRQVYCVAGCCPLSESKRDIVYNAATITNEDYSPPIMPSEIFLTAVGCRAGYTTEAVQTKAVSTLCKTVNNIAQWVPPESELVDCYKGCADIRLSVKFGTAKTTVEAPDNAASFRVGDEVSFSCKDGFALVGWPTVTCSARSVWSENLPECVYLQGGSGAGGLYITLMTLGIIIVNLMV